MVIFTAQHIAELRALFLTPYNGNTVITAGYSMPAYKDLMVIADTGYKIDQVYAQRNSMQKFTFTKNSGGTYATLDYTKLGQIADGQPTTFTGYMIAPPKTYFNQKTIDEFTANNLTVTVDGLPLSTTSEIKENMVMVATANSGFNINSISYYVRGGALKNFIVNVDLKTATSNDFVGFTIAAGVTFAIDVTIDTPDVLNVNDVYLIDDDSARLVSALNFTYSNGLQTFDYSGALLGLINLPFLFNEVDAFAEQTIRLGSFDTTIPALIMNFDKYNYSLGEITVPETKNNLLDFANTTCILHLPYAKSIVIDNEYVIGQTLYIDYLISMYDGTAIINLKSTKTGAVFYSNNIDMNINIPFANSRTAPNNNRSYDIELGGFNGLYVPYIEVIKSDMILENGFFTIPILDESLLVNQVGYIKVEEIELKTSATLTEKNMIDGLLKQGVIIK